MRSTLTIGRYRTAPPERVHGGKTNSMKKFAPAIAPENANVINANGMGAPQAGTASTPASWCGTVPALDPVVPAALPLGIRLL